MNDEGTYRLVRFAMLFGLPLLVSLTVSAAMGFIWFATVGVMYMALCSGGVRRKAWCRCEKHCDIDADVLDGDGADGEAPARSED